MLRVTKNKDVLEIKNVICFFVGETVPSKAEEVKKIKEDDWSYQDYLTMSCAKHKYNLIWLNKRYCHCILKDNIINIDDECTNVHISLNKDNVNDTIIFQGQANDEVGVNYETLMKAFEYMEFYMINTYDEIRMASDKILSANLLSSKNIPQPNYILVTKNVMMDKDNFDQVRDSFWDLLNTLYESNNNIEEGPERKYVVKILGGSLGIGVFICNHSEIEAILETIFAVDENRELIIQQFKKNTGDIRAHAFSVDGKHYEVIACMKRNKIAKDFRSNVSLGATTEEYDLTDKQKEIILSTAELSGCRWVGVDLMACEDGSDVVIEYNSSPGVQGISKQIHHNMFDVVLDKINEYFKKYPSDYEEKRKARLKIKTFSQYIPEVVDVLKTEWESLSDKRKKVLDECLSFRPGTAYRMYGKEDHAFGLDCSGYVKRVFKDSLDIELPDMCVDYFSVKESNCWEKISKSELKPGDIGVLNDATKYNHCGIYAGDDKWFENNMTFGVQLSDYPDFKYYFRIKDID